MASSYESVSSVKLSMSSDWFCLLPNLNFDSLTDFSVVLFHFRLVSKRDGGDHKRSPPSRLLTSVKILTSQAVVSIVLT